MKKGFTLIELLAVIIILAIVALIAVPIILNVVNDARISAGESEAQMIYSGINNYCATIDMKKQLGTLSEGDIDCSSKSSFSEEEISKMVKLGNAQVESITYSNGKVTNLVVISNIHKFTLCGDGSFVMDDEVCGVAPDTPEETGESLISTLLNQYQEGNEVGLIKDATNENLYYYTGTNEQVANNFLWYGGHQWRVLEFDTKEKTLTLITQQPLTSIQPVSAVWESEEAYNNSYINTWLNEYFRNSLDSSIQTTIQDSTFNVGIYNNVSEITTTKKVGLLDQAQYERAGSVDSFLNINDYWWLGNRYSSSDVRFVSLNGNLGNLSPAHEFGVRAVIKISDITITGGDGTLASSYQVANKATNTSDVQVGEYINVPYNGSDNACGDDGLCTFRVVSKDSNGIKVVLNGLLPTTSVWATNANDNITTSDLVYTNVLNGFIANIDSKYITTGTYGVGMYANGNSYTVPQVTTITANIGLPTVGEMFSGNDIDLSTSSTKTFVDVNTIENPTVSFYYWTMNRYSSSGVRNVLDNGNLDVDSPSRAGGVRAVIYLKSGTSAITFTGGEGTAQSPYTIQ